MSMVDELKDYYNPMAKPKRPKRPMVRTIVRYVERPTYVAQPMYYTPVKKKKVIRNVGTNYGSMLRNEINKDKYENYKRQKLEKNIKMVGEGVSRVGGGVKSVGGAVVGFVKSKKDIVGKLGLSGIFKKSIYD